jgi:hypothetical protein
MRKILLLSISILFGMIGYSQKIVSVSNPLEKFFQENYDSTIIYKSYNPNGNPIYIIGKKDDTIYYYYYYKLKLEFPSKNIGPYNTLLEFRSRYVDFLRKRRKDNLDIDESFFWVLTENTKKSLWEKIQSENLWNFIDDNSVELKSDFYDIVDGYASSFTLITKNKVMELSYFVPNTFSRIPKNHIRNRIVDVDGLIVNFYTQKIPYILNHISN